jgi:hypothetical protein
MAKRKIISKKLRFEVFKRDSFTCQYCGRMAPDVVLEVDHINPVVNGGDNDIMNLITSCFDCNRGKGKKVLSENETIKKQQEQLKELNEKREQLEMMLKWKKELSKFEDEQVQKCNELLSEYGRSLTEKGKNDFKKWIKKYGFIEVYENFQIALEQYVDEDDSTSYSKAINYVPKIINNKILEQNDPMLPKKHYIKGILRNRGMLYNEGRLYKFLNANFVNDNCYNAVKNIACNCNNWSDFWEEINEVWDGDW